VFPLAKKYIANHQDNQMLQIKKDPKTRAKLITHPETQETLNLTQWAQRIGIKPQSLSKRLQTYSDIDLIFSPAPIDKPKTKWSREEDELLRSIAFSINPIMEYQERAKRNGLRDRTERAISDRMSILRSRSKLPIKRGNTKAAVDAGVVNVSQLAECLNVTPPTVENFCKKGLRYTFSIQSNAKKIELKHFAKWATTPVGAVLVARAVKQDAEAVRWTYEIIGKWLWIG
jgi:hypothetical protein